MVRRRYDTAALVERLKTQRKTGLIFTVAAIIAFVIMVALFLSSAGDLPEPQTQAAAIPLQNERQNEGQDEQQQQEQNFENEKQALNSKEIAITEELEQESQLSKEESALKPKNEAPKQDDETNTANQGASKSSPNVHFTLSQRGRLWADKKIITKKKVRRASYRLTPGSHIIRAKIGKKSFKRKIRIKKGDDVRLFVDARRKKIYVKKK